MTPDPYVDLRVRIAHLIPDPYAEARARIERLLVAHAEAEGERWDELLANVRTAFAIFEASLAVPPQPEETP